MGTLHVYIQSSIFDEIYKKQREYLHSHILRSFYSSLFISLSFIIWYQSSNLRALIATFIMAEIIDPSQYFISPYHVSSQQHMVCSIGTQQERQFFGHQLKAMNDTNRSSFGRRYTSNVCSHCGKIGHVIDTCYRRHDFTPEQYQTLLTLLQQSKSSDNVSNQISGIPSNTTTHIGNKFLSSFSSWIIDSGATDHICSSLSYFTSYHQINLISVKLPNGNQVFANYSRSSFINQDHVLDIF